MAKKNAATGESVAVYFLRPDYSMAEITGPIFGLHPVKLAGPVPGIVLRNVAESQNGEVDLVIYNGKNWKNLYEVPYSNFNNLTQRIDSTERLAFWLWPGEDPTIVSEAVRGEHRINSPDLGTLPLPGSGQ